eukprot:TRINITY_DN10209_c0_g2_i1.p1 TRINITY_DN10209_c0_g2~~TRINITY_DN10209_c0_g2_i1.p1  ORF type:complete len:202 (-),score=11.94 TRINITY_DN10209_c0_g2_i1:90-695(-)
MEDLSKTIVMQVACVLQNVAQNFDAQLQLVPGRRTCFHASRVPGISLAAYLGRIASYSRCSASCFVVAFIYIDRILKINQDFTLCSLNIHRLILSAVVTAIKYLDDEYYNINDYAKIGGISALEMTFLEKEFLKFLDFRCFVDPKAYEAYEHQLRQIFEAQKVNTTNKHSPDTASPPTHNLSRTSFSTVGSQSEECEVMQF